MKQLEIFEVTPDHLKLLQRFNIFWHGNSYLGAPSVYPKKPYGNSSVLNDIATILGWVDNENTELSEEQEKQALKLHKETEIVLQICLSAQKFEPAVYFKELCEPWKKIDLKKPMK